MDMDANGNSPETLDDDSRGESSSKRQKIGNRCLTTAATVTDRGIPFESGSSSNHEFIFLDSPETFGGNGIISLDSPEASRGQEIMSLESPEAPERDNDETMSIHSEETLADNSATRMSMQCSEIVDLTLSDDDENNVKGFTNNRDDDDVLIVSEFSKVVPPPDIPRPPPGARPATAFSYRPNLICYGTLKGCRMRAFHIPTPPAHSDTPIGPDSWPPIPVTLLRAGDPSDPVIQVQDLTGSTFGTVDDEFARVLLPLMNHTLQLEAKTYTRAKQPGEEAGKRISGFASQRSFTFFVNVYGPESNRLFTGSLVAENGKRLEVPHYGQLLFSQYRNAHDQSAGPQFPVRSETGTHAVINTEDDVSSLFDKLNVAKDLPEMEPDARVTTTLIKHQKQGLAFLITRERDRAYANPEEDNHSLWRKTQNQHGEVVYYHVITRHQVRERPPSVRGGILADMMGLGKTLQILSLLVSTKSEAEAFEQSPLDVPRYANPGHHSLVGRNAKTTLLVSPLSTISNWEEQLKAHLRPQALSHYIYHGSNRVSDSDTLATYDVVITTYAVLAWEYRKHEQSDGQYVSPLQKLKFFRIVLDGKNALYLH
jgi:hypothetical protein